MYHDRPIRVFQQRWRGLRELLLDMHIDAMDSFRIIITDQIGETVRNGLMSGLCPATITQHLSYPFDPTALKEIRRLFEDKSTIIPLNDHKV